MGIYRVKKEGKQYWRYDVYVDGRRVRTPRGIYFPTKDECIDAVSAIRTDQRRGEYRFPADRSTVKLSQLREAWTAKQTQQLNRCAKHVQRCDRVLRSFASFVKTTNIEDIETGDIEKYYAKRVLEGIKPETAATEVSAIITALNNAPTIFKEMKDWRPPRKPKGISNWGSGRERVITREEEGLIIEALVLDGDPIRKQDARIFWFALRTGMREGEILGLQKASVCFDRAIKMEYGWIDVRRSHGFEHTKTKKNRIVPMSRTVAEMLREQINLTGDSIWVFPGKRGRRRPVTTLLNCLETACGRAGIPYGRNKSGGLVFHDTRHTAATRMLGAGIDLKTVGVILGHSDDYMTMHYAHATAASRQAAVASLEDESFRVRFESNLETEKARPARPVPKSARA